ncbi:MAG: hypothetical protein IJ257_03290 [Treponema sp.]|nr:hypothetical protein [Treponema sp.]
MILGGGDEKNDSSTSSELEKNISQVLGRGYNVFSDYITPRKVLPNQIIDLNLVEKKMGFSKKKIGQTLYLTKVGDSLQSYQKALSTSVKVSYGIDKLFSASLSTTFSENLTGENKYSYASVHTTVQQYACSIRNVTEAGMPQLVECITPEFRASIEGFMKNENFSPATLFGEYGTHVILGATFGGRYDYYKVYSRVKSSETYKLNVKLSASYSSSTGEDEEKTSIAGSAGVNSKNVDTSDISEYKTYTEILGGTNAFGSDLKDPDSYQKWISSVEPEANWTLIGFDASDNSIFPIWELIKVMGSGKSGDKYFEFAEKVGSGYVDYAKEQNLKYQAAYADWTDPNDQGRQCVWDFLPQRLANDYNSKPVIDKEVDLGNGLKANVAYYPIKQDLRHNAGGDYEYIYVAYCDVYNDKVIVKDSTGKESVTTLPPVNEIVVDNVVEDLSSNSYTYTEKLHYDSQTGSSHGGWMIGFKRGKQGAVRDAYIWNNTTEHDVFTDRGPALGKYDTYGADEVGHSKSDMKGKRGQNINRYMGGSYDNMFIYYRCDQQ